MLLYEKRETGNNSSASTREDEEGRDVETIPPYEYVCIHRPYFDREAEYRVTEDEGEEGGVSKKLIKEEEATGNIFQPSTKHKEWKWIMLCEGWTTLCDFKRKVNFCDPNNFGMHIYNDWKGYGVTEAVENLLIAFDGALKKKDENMCFQAWAIVSSIAHWLNDGVDGGMDFIHTDDGDRAQALNELVGCALLTALATIESAGELKPDSMFLDLPIVISSFLEWSDDLEKYGIEDDAIFWRSHAVEYFTKAVLDPSRGVFGTEKLLEKLKEAQDGYEEDTTGRSERDPWAWGKKLRRYKKSYGPRIGGSSYDITKMTREERAKYAFDGKDPLKNISEKDIKQGNLALA
ncbi:uncharacterized protein BDR25DRAFT_347554 [Lindgomyces ingoldianus]|uniref:Uncharacterized protein n=1 Tax=Lindgomyces ingoldianus TaxID=673940 RepID=A0ACB6Q966_9PLEO|nr:uncharacterized protein BDR25DRAFT_347554 [Lindgomyces ingoldianus]KAF2462897.1 hypothetical protein BDR25DRAFT_347554 [Lindgomyces ingoldianus]